MPSVAIWMGLEAITQSEVSQKEKDKYHRMLLICGIQKNVIDELTCKQTVTDVLNTRMVTKQELGWDGLGDWD